MLSELLRRERRASERWVAAGTAGTAGDVPEGALRGSTMWRVVDQKKEEEKSK